MSPVKVAKRIAPCTKLVESVGTGMGRRVSGEWVLGSTQEATRHPTVRSARDGQCGGAHR